MAILFTDGFDNYGNVTGTNITTRWQQPLSLTPSLITPFSTGQSATWSTFSDLPNFSITGTNTVTVGVYMRNNTLLPAAGTIASRPHIYMNTSSGYTMGFQMNSDGSAGVNRMTGFNTGVVLGTSTAKPFRTGYFHYIEFSVTLSATVGTVRVDVDGENIINLTNQNTQNGASNLVNTILFGTGGNPNATYLDDLYVTNSITPLGPQRIYTLRPNADTAEKDWAPTAGWWISKTGTNETGSFATKGNIFTAVANTTLKGVSINFYAQAMTGILGIAELSSVNPGTVSTILYQSSPFTRTAASGYQSFTFPDITFTATKIYAIYITRTDGTTTSSAPLIWQGSIDNVDPTGALVGSGWISKADTSITVGDTLYNSTVPIYNMILNYATANNYQGVQDTYDTDLDTSYVTASNVGDYDLYDVESYPPASANIKAVNQIVWARKTDATARTMNLTTKSGATTTDSTAVTLGASYAGYSRIYETDPNTASDWTVSGVNALQIGQKVAS